MTAAITLVNLFQSSSGERVLPLGILWLRAALERADVEVELRDFQFLTREAFGDPDGLAESLDGSRGILGLSLMSDSLPMAVALCRRLKERRPERRIVLGGPGPSTVATLLVRAFPWIDAIVRKEGEETLTELVLAWSEGGQITAVRGVDGRADGEPFHAPDRPFVMDLDTLAEPRIDDLDLATYSHYNTVTSRGCPFGCRFCEIHAYEERRVRTRSVENVVAELVRAHRDYGVSFVGFQDDVFFLSRERVEAILSGLEREGVSLGWTGFTRAGQVDPDWLAGLAKRGLQGIAFGVEAGSDALLGRVKKGLTLRQAFTAIASAVPHVHTRCFFLWGFPDETLEDFLGTTQAVFHAELLGAHVEVGQVVPLPGSLLYLQLDGELEYHDAYPFSRIIEVRQHEELRELVRAHPKIFPAFYSFPTPNREEKWAMAGGLCCRDTPGHHGH